MCSIKANNCCIASLLTITIPSPRQIAFASCMISTRTIQMLCLQQRGFTLLGPRDKWRMKTLIWNDWLTTPECDSPEAFKAWGSKTNNRVLNHLILTKSGIANTILIYRTNILDSGPSCPPAILEMYNNRKGRYSAVIGSGVGNKLFRLIFTASVVITYLPTI